MTAQELREESRKLADEAKTFFKTTEEQCAADERDMNATELATFDETLQRSKDCIEQARALEKEAVDQRLTAVEDWSKELDKTQGRAAPAFGFRPSPSFLPAVAKRTGKLVAFKGERAEERAYKAGKWIQATLLNSRAAQQWCRNAGIDYRAQSEGVNTGGGYLVPEEFNQTIIDMREERGVFRRECRIEPMVSDTQLIPRKAGGVTAYAVGENAAITESESEWDQVRITAKKWVALIRMSNEVSEDATISLADSLARDIAYAFADKEDEAGFNGDGTAVYHGVEGAFVKVNNGNHAGSIYVGVAGNTYFGALDLVDFEACIGLLPMYAEANAKWYISKAGYAASMLRLIDAAGGATRTELSAGGGVQLSFLGYPVVISQVLFKTLTASINTIHCMFGDLRMAATMGDRRGVSIVSDSSRYLEYDQTAVRGTTRFDINIHDLGDATDAGPLVALKTPAA